MRLRVKALEMSWPIGEPPQIVSECSTDKAMPCCGGRSVVHTGEDWNVIECRCGASWRPTDLGVKVGPDGAGVLADAWSGFP